MVPINKQLDNTPSPRFDNSNNDFKIKLMNNNNHQRTVSGGVLLFPSHQAEQHYHQMFTDNHQVTKVYEGHATHESGSDNANTLILVNDEEKFEEDNLNEEAKGDTSNMMTAKSLSPLVQLDPNTSMNFLTNSST